MGTLGRVALLCAVCTVLMGCGKRQEIRERVEQAKVVGTRATLKQLRDAVNRFKMDTGRYPTEEEGLAALVYQPTDVQNWPEGGYLDMSELPLDGWGNDFIYQANPGGGRAFVIISLGADGRQGGEGFDADLSD